MNRELTIIVAGNTGSGKSTIMLELERLLSKSGYEVELSLENHPEYAKDEILRYYKQESSNFEEKANAIKPNLKITLKEMQVKSKIKFNEG